MSINVNWATVIAVVSALAGVAGSVITPIWGTNLATQVQVTLQAFSALLVVIAGGHATSVTAASAKMKAAARLAKPA